MPERLTRSAGPADRPAVPADVPAGRRGHTLGQRVGLFLAACLLVGAVAGLVWSAVVDLPGYVVAADGRAVTTERGLAQQFGADAWFVVVGAVGGLLLGVVAWWRLVRIGWPVILLTLAGAGAAALLCWGVGFLLGPGDLAPRLSAAQPGDVVPIELTLRAPVSLVVWPFLATVPVLLWSSLAPDDEQPSAAAPRRARRSRGRHESVAGVLPEHRLDDPPGTGSSTG